MLHRLSSNIKEKSFIKTNTLSYRSLPARLNQTFISYLDELNQDNDIKELAKNINWKSIIQNYKKECYKIRSQFSIPEVIDALNVKNLDIAFYSLVIQTTVHSLFYYLYLILKNYTVSNESLEGLDYNLTKNLSPIIKQYLSSYYFPLELTSITGHSSKPKEITAVEEFKALANLGIEFSKGKNFDPKEIQVFKLILQQYNKACQTDYKKSFKAIAYFLGKNELELLTKEEQHRFYKRFIAYKSCIQK
jgi:hypothetical protein